jgi:hypothetical protein
MISKGRIIKGFIYAFLSALILQDAAHSLPTKWEDARTTFSSLLDAGWQVSAHGTNRAATSPGASGYTPYDEETFSFLLTKNGKYIMCFIVNPRPPVAKSASCRILN